MDRAEYEVSETVLGLKCEDVVPAYYRTFIQKKNEERLQKAKKLDLDLSTLSISRTTGLILFHGVTDEQMESESQNGDTMGLKDIRMWDRFCEAVEDQSECERMGSFEMEDLKKIAVKIAYNRVVPVARSSVKKIVEDCHRRFLGISCPIDAVISVLAPRPSCGTHLLKGSEGDGRVTLEMLYGALCSLKGEDDYDEEWYDEAVYRFMRPLRRFISGGHLKWGLHDDLKRFRDDYGPAHPPSVIYPFLKTLPREEQIRHWVTVLDAVYDKFGYYAEVKNEYLRPLDHFPDIWPEVDAQLARNRDPSTTEASESEDSGVSDADKASDRDVHKDWDDFGHWKDFDSMWDTPKDQDDWEDWEDWVSGRASKKRKIGDA